MKTILALLALTASLFPVLSFAQEDAAQQKKNLLMPTQILAWSPGFQSSSPLGGYPTQPMKPSLDRSIGWTVTYQLPADATTAWDSGMLVVRFTPPAQKPALAIGFEIYEIDGAPNGPLTTDRPEFLGSACGQLVGKQSQAHLILDSAKPFLTPGKLLHLLIIPYGDPVKSPTIALPIAPTLYLNPAGGYVFDDMMAPLWKGTHTLDESVMFARAKPGDPATAPLLHAPKKIERVYSFAQDKTYAEGTDWTLGPDGRLVAPAGSTLRIVDDSELHPASVAPGAPRTFKTNDGRNLTAGEVTWDYDRDLWITYSHADDWKGPVPALAEQELPKTLARLRAKQPLKIVLCGDSISVGAGATSQEMLAPYLPPWPVLVTRKLREQYQAPVTLVNRSLGGMIAAWGETNAPMLVQPEAADLCLIGFGMNDRGRPVPVADFMKQIQSIISAARAGNPNVEIILIASWHNNPEWGPSQPLNDYRTAMMALQGPGIAVADLTDISGELLKHKPFVDMSSNNVNHPNDYMVRWYAQAISALLVPQP